MGVKQDLPVFHMNSAIILFCFCSKSYLCHIGGPRSVREAVVCVISHNLLFIDILI